MLEATNVKLNANNHQRALTEQQEFFVLIIGLMLLMTYYPTFSIETLFTYLGRGCRGAGIHSWSCPNWATST